MKHPSDALMDIGLEDMQREMRTAVEKGLRQHFGDFLGGMLVDVVNYRARIKLEHQRLRELVENDAAAVASAIVSNRTDGALMLMIRSQMIGSALLSDRDAVVRWATEGLSRSRRVAGPWTETERQWQWVLEDPTRYIMYARQLKYFLSLL
jgi:hypothetical protein